MTIAADIRSDWKLLTIEELASREKGSVRIGPFGSALKKHELTDEGVRVLGIDHVLPNRLVWDKPKFISSAKYRELKQYTVRPGDLLVTNMGTVGRACVVPDVTPTSIISSHLIKVSLNAEIALPRYVAWAVNACPSVLQQIRMKCQGAIMAGFNSTLLKELKVPLPPISEQKRIAAILDAAEALREKGRLAISVAESLIQVLFAELFGDPIDNPHRFPVRPLIKLIDPNRPISYGILKPGEDCDDGVRYVRVVDMQNGGISVDRLRRTTHAISRMYRRSLLESDDLLLSIRGHVGRVAVVPAALTGANITQDTARLAITKAIHLFVREFLRHASVQRWMQKHTKGVAVKGINLGDVKQIPVPVPPLQMQRRFASIVMQLDAVLGRQHRAVASCVALSTSLQQRAFRGEL